MQAVNTSNLWPPFSNPVMHSQQAFRLLLKAMSEPGTLVSFENFLNPGALSPELSDIPHWPDLNISLASYVVALTLLDQDTKVWLSNSMATSEFIDNLRFHCGARLLESSLQADFAFMSIDEWSSFENFKEGSEENPHFSATLIIQAVKDFESSETATDNEAENNYRGESETLIISGPGVPSKRWVQVPGLTPEHIQLLQHSHQLYPLGKDLLFTFGSRLMALPRSTAVDTCVQHAGPEQSVVEYS